MSASEVIEGTAVVVEEERALTVVEREGLNLTRTPEETVALATRMANALVDIVERKHLFAVISGKKFPVVEAWMTIARMDNVVAREIVGGTVRLEDGGYESMVELIRLSDGMVIGRGSALCGSPGDSPWDRRGEPARRSMAVTRATSRAFRQQYSWIMAIAGYEATPAEEMGDASGDGRQPARPAPRAVNPSQPAQSPTPPSVEAPGPSETGEGIQAVVAEAPEAAVRIVRDAHVPKRWEGECPKLEVVTKVGNRKHTAIILGPLAEATVLVGLEVGDVVQFYGAEVEEIVWQEGKPTRKEIVGRPPSYLMTDVQTVVDGKWRSVKEAMPTLLPPDPSPSSAPASSPEQPVPEPVADQVSSSAPPSLPITTPPRMKGTPGEWVTLQGPLVDAIQFTTKGDVPVAIMRVADETTGEIVFAALAADIEQQVGSASKPFAKAGDRVGLYGEWKGDWLVVEMVGLATP